MILKNDRGLDVKNGMLGELTEVSQTRLSIHLDNGRDVSFDLKDFAHVDYGYAATIHKAQGVTVDNTHVLATPGLDRHSAYVALSRHRESVHLHYGRDDFAEDQNLTKTLSRDRAKDMVSDYAKAQDQTPPSQTPESEIQPAASLTPESDIKLPDSLAQEQAAIFAFRRGIDHPKELDDDGPDLDVENELEAPAFGGRGSRSAPALDNLRDNERGKQRGIFAGFTPSIAARESAEHTHDGVEAARASQEPSRQSSQRDVAAPARPGDDRRSRVYAAIQKHARIVEDINEMRDANLPVLPDQKEELQSARKTLSSFNRHYASDLEDAYRGSRALTQETAAGNPRRAIQVLQVEAEIRVNPQLRADRFVQQWRRLSVRRQELYAKGDYSGRDKLTDSMDGMARGLERDPQVESILENRKRELGISISSSNGISMSLLDEIGRGRQRGLSIGF
jgi:hypothetical protein